MELQDACVGLDGELIVPGRIDFPHEDQGHFRHKDTGQLAINRQGFGLTTCIASRTPSGFFEVEEYGVVLSIPGPFANLIEAALRKGGIAAQEERLNGQHGYLYSARNNFTPEFKRKEQPLSDWRIKIEERQGFVNIELSAALYGQKLRDWLSSEENFWNKSDVTRVEASFSVDPATRQACCNAYLLKADRNEEANSPAEFPRLSDNLSLQSAAVSDIGNFAISDDSWIYFHSSPFGLSLTEHSRVVRQSNGFLSHGHYQWPRYSFAGVNLLALENLDKAPLKLSGAGLRAMVSDDRREGWREAAEDAELELALNERGLVTRFDIKTSRRKIEQECVLPWEVLILRYPNIGDKWNKICRG